MNECLIETQTDPQQSLVTESDDQTANCEPQSEVGFILLILNV